MKRLLRPSLGLMGRVFAILLLAILIEFGASTFIMSARASSRCATTRRAGSPSIW
ncbi:hypothetical protein [Sphingomonas sp. 7/4-4]|uniref:hypothetical protein n=1 Tax=Sphingomonas sp. 7/4-4 TaxID=3018446 RepID=UPI00300E1EFD